MEFGWTADEKAFRRELLDFLKEVLPHDWEEIAKDGRGATSKRRFRGSSVACSPRAVGSPNTGRGNTADETLHPGAMPS